MFADWTLTRAQEHLGLVLKKQVLKKLADAEEPDAVQMPRSGICELWYKVDTLDETLGKQSTDIASILDALRKLDSKLDGKMNEE